MAQYIDKDAVEAKIDKLANQDFSVIDDLSGRIAYLQAIEDFYGILDTLEVKEVDLEKVIEEYFKGWTDDYDNGGAACHYQYVQVNDCKAIAKYFFELGLKTQKRE